VFSESPKIPAKAMRQLLVKQYLAGGRVPWSPGYLVYRQNFIAETLHDAAVREKFRRNEPLPPAYGVSLDERCVEYPWLFAHLSPHAERILGAGSALNFEFLLRHAFWQEKRLHILTLAPEPRCYWELGISYLFEDLRELPVRDDYYDVVVCLSTLEHIGFDNRQFTGLSDSREHRPQDFVVALREMRRVLKPGGHLLLTVPFGRYKNIGAQQIFDEKLLQQVISAFGAKQTGRSLFAYSSSGWQLASIEACRGSEYVDWIMLPKNGRSADFPIQPDGAAAARAVACLKLEK
jgi:SAM-dependent methyltransferase